MTENTAIIKIIDEITARRNITLEQLHMLLETDDMQAVDYLRKRASEKAHETYGNQVFIRGLIEFTNYCKNDCLYCGIRHSNTHADRYRLSTEQIMACCESGYELGFRTFVLQGGEDPYYTDERICEIVSGIKAKYPDCAVTLSIGEKSKESYQSYFDAGADRYLLRHETADEKHYSRLHPVEMSLANRKQCLWDLKEIGYQVGCVGCTGQAGVCGKTSETARLQDRLTGALIGLARASNGEEHLADDVCRLMIRALFATLTNVNFDPQALGQLIDLVHREKERLAPGCAACGAPCGKTEDYDMTQLWNAPEDIRSLKSLVLFGIRGMAAYAYHAMVLDFWDDEVAQFFRRALFALGEDWGMDELLPLALEVGERNLACMALLDRANTHAFGTPEPIQVSMAIEPGPFIVVSGHDLLDLKLLLDQTAGTGVSVYTHGEMLPAHGYPNLRAYPHLKGNFGTAWQNQQQEFDGIPAPILFTTNCLMPPKKSYADRVFTTGAVGYPGMVHIGADRDFSPVIQKALELGGYANRRQLSGINGGTTLTTGFAHGAVLARADQVVEAVKSGAIRHFFLVGGCDGARPGRSYYTEFVKLTPPDTVVLTLACGKFRFNDLDLGTVAGLPRLMDVGQCNDAYSAIQIALALANVFGCGVNELPLSMVLSWYEQKAVCILLTLLHLGIQNIRLGPTLPAFLSPNVLAYLAEHYHIAPITTPERDLMAMLGE